MSGFVFSYDVELFSLKSMHCSLVETISHKVRKKVIKVFCFFDAQQDLNKQTDGGENRTSLAEVTQIDWCE